MSRHAVLATHEAARASAEEAIAGGSSALEGALAGWLGLAGETTWALFAPMTIALTGSGSGVTFVDGRARQGGKGLERPARHESRERAPAASRVPAPGSIGAVAVAAAIAGARMAGPSSIGVKRARDAGAKSRARMVGRVGAAGNLALSERWVVDAILSAAPRIDGALLGAEDLAEVRPEVASSVAPHDVGGVPIATPPWADPDVMAGRSSGDSFAAILVADGRGALAAVVIEAIRETLPILDGELELPLVGEPPVKGVPRLRPGTPIGAAAPIGVGFEGKSPSALLTGPSGRIDEALVMASGLAGEAAFANARTRALVVGWVAASRSAFARQTG